MDTTKQVLKRQQVEAQLGFKRSHLYALMAEGSFPKPIKLGARAVGWLQSEVNEWLEARIQATRGGK